MNQEVEYLMYFFDILLFLFCKVLIQVFVFLFLIDLQEFFIYFGYKCFLKYINSQIFSPHSWDGVFK
jgi:hypothetical protein